MPRRPLLLALAILAPSCQNTNPESWTPTAGVGVLAFDAYDGTLTQDGVGTLSGDVDASSVEVQIGATSFASAAPGADKQSFVGLRLATGEGEGLFQVDVDELAGGAIWYSKSSGGVTPYASIWSVLTTFDIPGSSSQLGVELGGGFELAVNEAGALFVEGGLLVPLREAQYAPFRLEYEGIGIRLGFRTLLGPR